MDTNLSIRARVFYVIRYHDVELAEDFLSRCYEVQSIAELNQFFRQLMADYRHNTQALTQQFTDGECFESWQQRFVANVLPSLRSWRLPPRAGQRHSIYDTSPPQYFDNLLRMVSIA